MNFDLETVGVTLIGLVLSTAESTINSQVDATAAKIVAAVKSSETKMDDTVAVAAAAALERLAQGIRTGLAS